ncbi:MAG TPA: aryl-sulfate sulfotransferase [Polyangiaceae bacterium]|nr:aryl-sulfate sulfotransferase [Polyangiaceae bacterium]
MPKNPGGTRRLGALFCAVYPLLGGCASDALPSTAPGSVSASPSTSIGTVATVTWKTSTPTIGYVSYGTTKSVEQSAPLETAASVDHSRTLLGLAADTTYYYRVITWDTPNVTAGQSEVLSFHTAPLPAGTPTLHAEHYEVLDEDGKPEAPMDDYVIVPFVRASGTTVGIVDPAGALIWYHLESEGRRVTRARLSGDNKSVLYTAINDENPADSAIVRVAIDGSSTSSLSVPNLGSDFAVHADGTLAVLMADTATMPGVVGDKIVEIDPAGAQKTVFTTFNCFDPAKSPGDGSTPGWTGASALQLDSQRDVYYLALRNLSSVVQVNRESGACDWVLGDDDAHTLEFAQGASASAPTRPFVHPGGIQGSASRLVVLDADGGANGSRTAVYGLDFDTSTATETHAYDASPRVDVEQQGEATVVAGRAVLSNWSNGSRMDLVSESGALIWKLEVTSGERLGYHTAFRDLYDVKVEGNQ